MRQPSGKPSIVHWKLAAIWSRVFFAERYCPGPRPTFPSGHPKRGGSIIPCDDHDHNGYATSRAFDFAGLDGLATGFWNQTDVERRTSSFITPHYHSCLLFHKMKPLLPRTEGR